MPYPHMIRVRQHFERPLVEDVPAAVFAALDKLSLGRTIRPGQSVAITAGSRGIASILPPGKSVTGPIHFARACSSSAKCSPACSHVRRRSAVSRKHKLKPSTLCGSAQWVYSRHRSCMS